MAESPVLLIGGAAATLSKGRGALQDIDQMSLFKSLCKYTATIRYIRDIPSTLRTAIQVAQSGTPGPVFVEFPIDSLYPYHLVQRELGIKSESKSLMQTITSMYLNNYLASLFAGAFDPHDYKPIKPEIPTATQSQIQSAVELISKAKRPVVLVGSQSTLPPVPAEDLAKALNVCVFLCSDF
jgi:acetolactate synthase-like protein